MPTSRNPELDEVITLAVEDALQRVRTNDVATVVSYDPSTERAIVQIRNWRPGQNSLGELIGESLPNTSARVLFPSGAGLSLSWTPQPGDEGVLLSLSSDPSAWVATGQDGPPTDARMHHIGNAVFIPTMVRSSVVQPSGGPGAVTIVSPVLKLGDDAATSFVALATLVKTELTKIQTTLSSASVASFGPVAYGTPYAAGDVAATKVKAT